jgi:hypothetical protein
MLRYAILFKPGNYSGVNVRVGYYVQVLGLGETPDIVTFSSKATIATFDTVQPTYEAGVYCPTTDQSDRNGAGSLDTFWRSAENFTIVGGDMLWAVSQAAPLRSVRVPDGNLFLHNSGFKASGGFLANSVIKGKLFFGSQQQWCTR